ncbi:MAG: alpha/beta hydrolase [Lysobacterales bacterium]
MKSAQTLTFLLLGWLSYSTIEASEPAALTLPRIQVLPIEATRSNKQYELYIKLPESYSEHQDKTFPVIYFTDALWHVELLSGATEFMMEDVILVGISWQKDIAGELKQEYGAHFSRFGDYSFKKTSNPRHPKITFGQADSHLAFIRDDVFSYVEKNYRTQPDNRTYFGFSAGGGFGAYVLMAHSDTFRNYILGSPSIWSNAPALFALASPSLNSQSSAINVFISYGDLETEMSPSVDSFISELKNKKYDGISSIKHTVIESSGHSDSFPQMGIQSVIWLASLQNHGAK